YMTLRSGADVLEIPWKQRYLWFVNLPVGELCTIVVRDERPLNLVPLIVFRSDREHRNREAMAADMFAVYPLIRIEQESRVVWDNSICEVHHTKMEHTTAPIVYGLYWPTPSDDVCDARYPHHFDYAWAATCYQERTR
ncbi:MAG: hypothetical protein QOI22_1678, partial [Verrucomicrobiota bacterium]